jgi:ABC-2 type transport system ATP-binding protein
MDAIIQTTGLSKRYYANRREVQALSDLSLVVRRGEIFGYLGPNGAGKTTTIRLLLDFIRPSAGSAQIFGLDVRRDSVAIRRRVGYLPAELVLWENLTAREIVSHFARVRGCDLRFARQLAERLEFDMSRRMRTYSTGNKRKIGLVLAMMHQPELLILDEPTSGLDPLMQQVFIQLVREGQAAGQTVFLSSHMLSEVQAVCDRVGILRHGKLETVDQTRSLTHVDFRWVTITLREPLPASVFEGIPGVQDVSQRGESIHLRLTGEIDPLLRALSQQHVVDLRTQDPSLEEIFLTYYGDEPSLNGNHQRAAAKKEGVR